MRYILKVRQVGDTLVVTIPKEIAKLHDLKKGDEVMMVNRPVTIVLIKEKK